MLTAPIMMLKLANPLGELDTLRVWRVWGLYFFAQELSAVVEKVGVQSSYVESKLGASSLRGKGDVD